MPIKFDVNIKLIPERKKESVTLITPDQLHGFFFSLIPPRLAEEFHNSYKVKPFSIWAREIFNFTHRREDESGETPKETPKETLSKLTLTIGLLKDEYFPQIVSELFEEKKNLYLGPYKVKIELKNQLIRNDTYFSYESALEIKPKPYLSFTFLTPVAFKKGEIDYPLPDPKNIFKSLIKKWNYFSPYKISVDLREALENKVCILFTKIRTHKIKLSLGSGVTGFTGKVVISGKGLTQEELLWLNVLGEFSNFSGVGRKTSMGLGLTNFKALEGEEK
ncbi:MAG: CRISPR system precrRNA processing endoribonuclease RAMP protein Cas6 [Caldimicrobium sp.]|jgi:CRISPR-associated endoribonuclease Cas6